MICTSCSGPARSPFGGEITDHRVFDGLTVPNAGNWGWFYGTERWHDGEFFRCRITGYDARSGTGSSPEGSH